MPKNVEVKAKVDDIEKLLAKAKVLCNGAEPECLRQQDTFFTARNGRLKLREFVDSKQAAELIYYQRPDTEGPKVSEYVKVTTDDPMKLKEALGRAMGIHGEVNKMRYLYVYGQTRIHIDSVESLGDFMELEVCLNDDQSVEEGELIANDILELLGIPKDSLIQGAYMDAILQQKT
ncbi:hypothetical protein AAVH_09234 [Aphelenchoides avenae]|nr:hypothetical protein AAVH_09234 [Aphelenchus avenae]